jgi:ABC-2 type transport system permease protein
MDFKMSIAVAETGQEQASSAAPQAAPLAQAYPAPGNLARFFGNTWAITKKELNVYFTTPLAYVLFAIFLVILSVFFKIYLGAYIQAFQRQMMMMQFGQGQDFSLNFTDHIFNPVIGTAGVVMLFIVPFLTMRLIAEEKRQQTFQLLMTTPVRSWEIVLGKFFASQILVLFAILLTVVYPLMLNSYAADGKVEMQTAFVAYVGVFLFASTLMAIGLFISSLTDSQVVAAAVTFGVSLVMWVLSGAGQIVSDAKVKALLEYASVLTHLQKFLQGKVAVADACYFLTIILLGLFLTRTSIERSRW